MKKIHLIRHAKSSWNDETLADIDRPLNKRGINTCSFMAKHILDAGCNFEHVFCSPAVRAQSTIELLAKHLPGKEVIWQTDEQLYCFESKGLVKWLKGVDESLAEIVMVGHNPALTDLSNTLCDSFIENIPTCGYVQLNAPGDFPWKEIAKNKFELAKFLQPKKLQKAVY